MHRRVAAALLFAVACAHQPVVDNEPVTLRSTVLMSSNRAGSQVVTKRGNEYVVDYEYTDRGRGPKTHSVMRLDERGLPASVATSGNDYYKVAVEESFTADGGVARWKNTSEQGEAKSGAFYSGMYGPPEEMAMLVRAAMRNGGRTALLPSGEAHVRKADELTVRGTHITAYEIAGLDFTPVDVWLDDQQNLFGLVSAWYSVIREGYEGDAPRMIAADDARASARMAKLGKTLTHVPAGN
ncbi:MAG TPA: hypothetical protein VF608_04315, partial [Thermoanaerobaculia bacterium]